MRDACTLATEFLVWRGQTTFFCFSLGWLKKNGKSGLAKQEYMQNSIY